MIVRKVSEAVIRRLPKYYRQLIALQAAGWKGYPRANWPSRCGSTHPQVRQDFNCFGGFGQQGYGYNVQHLLEEIRNILALDPGLSRHRGGSRPHRYGPG